MYILLWAKLLYKYIILMISSQSGTYTLEIVTTHASTWSHELSSLRNPQSSPDEYTHPSFYRSCICILTMYDILASHLSGHDAMIILCCALAEKHFRLVSL